MISAKQRHGKDPIFPLVVALSGLSPLTKVSVNYLPSKNTFVIKVNGADIYNLVKEEVDFDPTKTENLYVSLIINEKGHINGTMPWIIDDVEDKIQNALGMEQLTSLDIRDLDSKSWAANEFLDVLCCYDMPEHGLDKLILYGFEP